MTEYILWISLVHKLLLVGVPHTVLASRPTGMIVSAGEKEAARLAGPGGGGTILYFTRGEYDEAVRGLTPAEIDEVIAARLAAANLVNDGEWAVSTAVRRCLARSAVDKQDAYFTLALTLLADLLQDRFKGFSDKELFDAIERTKARLRAEAQAAAADVPAAATRFRELEADAARDLSDLAEPAISLGLPDYRKISLYVDVERVYFVTPLDARLTQKLNAVHAVYVPFDGGAAVEWKVRRAGELPAAKVMDVGGDRLLDLVSRFAKPQLLRELKQRRAAAIDAAAYDAWFDVLLLESALTTQKAGKVLAERGRSLAAAVVKVAEREGARLRRRWMSGSTYATPGPLRACHQGADTTAELVRTLALAKKDTDAAARMQKVRAALAAMKP